MKNKGIILNGIIKENPTFALFLGMCPVLAATKSVYMAIGMAACVFLVLLLSNISISLIAKITPDEIRIPVYIAVIASIVTIIQMIVRAFAPGVYSVLGGLIAMVVVNCIILGRAESFASKNNVLDSIKDAIGISLGFLMAVVSVGLVREILGTGHFAMADLNGVELFNIEIIPAKYVISSLQDAEGAFLTLGIAVGVFSAIIAGAEARKAKKAAAAAVVTKNEEVK